jgi:hypothetical protein
MSENEEEIKEILLKFQRLQLQQTVLVNRLEELTDDSNNRDRRTNAPPAAAARATGAQGETREFAVGDSVRIKNPRPLQQSVGVISKITTTRAATRIHVKTRNGSVIWRAPNNIVRQDE